MQNCEQMTGMSVYEHGVDVMKHTFQLINSEYENFKLPTWWDDKILDHIHDHETIKNYTLFHDCGKPYCLEYDNEGRKHFPDHANVSHKVWTKFHDNQDVANLIKLDMVLHTETAEQINSRNIDKKTLLTLLVVALAELHSNSRMFGGIESTSFKIKWKKLQRRGNMILKGLEL